MSVSFKFLFYGITNKMKSNTFIIFALSNTLTLFVPVFLYSCLEIQDPFMVVPGCYPKETQVKDGDYPKCCKQDRNVCPADKDFDISELEAFQSQQMVDITRKKKKK